MGLDNYIAILSFCCPLNADARSLLSACILVRVRSATERWGFFGAIKDPLRSSYTSSVCTGSQQIPALVVQENALCHILTLHHQYFGVPDLLI